jgi:Cu-Zn family superoxide dismutase
VNTIMLVLIAWLGSAGVAETGSPARPARAEVAIEPLGDSGVKGRATFRRANGAVELTLVVEKLPAGAHAVHLHEKGDCSAPDGASAGGHWNPSTEAHGKWGSAPFHHGDIGNLVPGPDGTAKLTLKTDLWTLGDGTTSDVVGRSIIVHAAEDDFTTQPTGNAGGRIACGVVRAGD